MYSSKFKDLILNSGKSDNFYVGTGCPNSSILLVGKEAAIGCNNAFEKQNKLNYLNNLSDWKYNVKNNVHTVVKDWNYNEYLLDSDATNNPLFSFKGVKIMDHKEGQTWRKYQKLHDVIMHGGFINNNNRSYDFQKNFFITEMSDNPVRTTRKAKKQDKFLSKLQNRKISFFTSNFIMDFPIVILACGDYIWNYGDGTTRQILNIFGADFTYCFETKSTKKPQRFYVHKNKENEKPKMVIHTNQLSGSVASNELLIELGNTIREFMNENNLKNNNY